MNIGYLNKLMYTFKMDIINHLPITRWDFDGIFEYIKKITNVNIMNLCLILKKLISYLLKNFVRIYFG